MQEQVAAFQTTTQKAHEWLRDLVKLGQLRDALQAYSVLRAVLHALRDRLILEEAAQLGAQLPMLIRGLYFEGWKPAATPERIRSREEFVERVQREFRGDIDVRTEAAIASVFQLLETRITEGEIEDVRGMLPEEIRDLWPESVASHSRS